MTRTGGGCLLEISGSRFIEEFFKAWLVGASVTCHRQIPNPYNFVRNFFCEGNGVQMFLGCFGGNF